MEHAFDAASPSASRAAQSRPVPAVGPLLGAPNALFLAWLLLALIDMPFLAIATADDRLDLRVRLLLHAYTTGHILLLGLASYAVVRLWALAPARLSRAWYVALGVAVAAVAVPLLKQDVSSFFQRQGWPLLPSRLASSAAVGVAVAGASVLGNAASSRRLLAAIFVALGLAAAIASHLVLPEDYPGARLFTSLGLACALGPAMKSFPVPAFVRRVPRRTARALAAVLVVGAGASLAVRPAEDVWYACVTAPGALVSPYLARLGSLANGPRTLLALGPMKPWFTGRDGRPDVPPTGPRVAAPDAIVLFLTIDAMRADLFANNKYSDRLPELTALASESVTFQNTHSPTPSTMTTFASIFTGRYYSQLYWVQAKSGKYKDTYGLQEDESPTVPELLAKGGVRTVQVVGVAGLSKDSAGLRGFQEEIKSKQFYEPVQPHMDLVLQRLEKQGPGPLFLYTHFIEPHAPYDRAGTEGTDFERYLGEVARVDAELGRLRRFLAERGLAGRTTLIVSADHGEAFGEHKLNNHANSVFEELLRVPLFVRIPGAAPRTVKTPVTLMDMGPTLLDMFGLAAPATFMGQSLAPALRGQELTLTRPIVADSGRLVQAMLFPDGRKAIRDKQLHTYQLYDLTTDPGERTNLITKKSRSESGTDVLDEFFRVHTLARDDYAPPWRRY